MDSKFKSLVAMVFVSCIALAGCNPQGDSSANSDQSSSENETSSTSEPAKTQSEPARIIEEPAPASCANCGRITSIRAVETAGASSGAGAVAGAVVGGLLGNQVGGGSGKKIATVAGAVGGAFAGNQIEKSQRKDVYYEVSVSMDDGSQRVINLPSAAGINEGMDVEVIGNEIHIL